MNNKKLPLTNEDIAQALDVVWDVLQDFRETLIPEGTPEYDSQWDDICTAMAWIQEDLGREEASE